MKKGNTRSKAYIIETFRVSQPVFDYIWNNLLKDLKAVDKHLLAHILCGHINNHKNNGWTPISSQLIRSQLPKANWKNLYDRDLIEHTLPNIQAGLSSEYRIKPNIYWKISDLFPKTTDEIISSKEFNLCNGKSLQRKKPQKTIFTCSGNEIFSEYQKAAIKNIKPCKVNRLEVDRILKKRQDILNSGNYTKSQRLKFDHDFRCWRGIVSRRTDLDNVFLTYQPAFKSQGSGRITELDGCYQCISRELKGAMFKDSGYKNYDLKSSQILGAKAEFESANLDTKWFDEYIKLGKHHYANEIGVNVDCWKGILLLILFGGFPRINKDGSLRKIEKEDLIKYKCIKNFIFPELEIELEWLHSEKKHKIEDPKNQIEKTYDILNKTIDLCKPLIINVKLWHNYIAKNYVKETKGKGGKIYFHNNQCKKKIYLNDFMIEKSDKKNGNKKLSLSSKGKRKLAAHILQGKEATFVHYLTKLSTDPNFGGYTVVSNQHDGLIVEGVIPVKTILKTKSVANLKYGEFEEKSIC